MKKAIVKRNRYVDSVTLMSVGDGARKIAAVDGAEAMMGTQANRESLESFGYEIPASAGANDLILAASGEAEAVEAALRRMEEILNQGRKSEKVFSSLDDEGLSGYRLVQISLPGEYAGEQAKKALEKGYDVFMFSDNVSLEEEYALKKYASERGLLCMGPDCGVAQIGGVALGAGSILKAGRLGVVGASGSGAQEAACIVEGLGEGISQLIGTGGRDLMPEIGGIVMKQGMKILDDDPKTEAILLVSKLADKKVMESVLDEADRLKKPVVAVFLGGDESLFAGRKTLGAYSLEEAALKAVGLLGGRVPDFGFSEEELGKIAERELALYGKEQKYLRGLYCGGTFAEEGLIYYRQHCKEISFFSNLGTKYAEKLADKERSVGNTVLDLGAEDFTADAPHPVFEPKLRVARLKKELADKETAVVTLDFITGPGVHEDPVGSFIEEIKRAGRESDRHITLIANVCGSAQDPQNVAQIKQKLLEAGVIVTESNIQTAKLAARIMNGIKERNS